MKQITANRTVQLTHWYEIPKGATITFRYRNSWWSKRSWSCDWEFELSENVRRSYESVTYGVSLSNLFGDNMKDIDPFWTMEDATFKDYFNALKDFLEGEMK